MTDAYDNAGRRAFFVWLAVGAAVILSALAAGRRAFGAAALCDPFYGCGGAWDAVCAAGRLLLPSLAAFLAVFLFAFSPLSISVSLLALAARGLRLGAAVNALVSRPADAKTVAAFIAYALGAAVFCAFCAYCSALSPGARQVSFSSAEGRREAAAILLSFPLASGAASIMTLLCALILHFG